MTETIIGGRRSRFISSRTAPGVVLDVWEDLEAGPGNPHRVGVVVTFAQGQGFISESNVANPWVPEPVFCAAWCDDPNPDPVTRFQQAYAQERARAAERLGGPVQFSEVGRSS